MSSRPWGFYFPLTQFLGYALGIGFVLIALTIDAAAFLEPLAGAMRTGISRFRRNSALFLVGAGAYLLCYWRFLSGAPVGGYE